MITEYRNNKGLFLLTVYILIASLMALSLLLGSCAPKVAEEAEEEVPPEFPRGNDYITIRGATWPGHSSMLGALKSIGVNYIQIHYWIEVKLDGEVLGDEFSPDGFSKAATIAAIKEVHEAGLKVYLQLYPEYYGTQGRHEEELEIGPVRDKEQFKDSMKAIVQEWAQIAEENGVELFSPTCELIIFLPWNEASDLYVDLASISKSVYSVLLV